MGVLYLTIGLVLVSLFDLRVIFSSSAFMSISISVLELKLLANSNSEVSWMSSVVFEFLLGSVHTLPFSSLMKRSWSAHLPSCMAWCISVYVMWSVLIVSGPVLISSAGILSGQLWGESELVSSRMSFCLPRLNVVFSKVALSESSGFLVLSVSIGSASGSLFVSIIAIRFGLDGDFVNRPSGSLGRFPLLLFSCTKSDMGLLMFFLCIIVPLGVVTVCLVPDIAIWGFSEYALSNLDR